MSSGEVFVVTGSGLGHVNPSMELCKHLLARDFGATLVTPSNLSSSIPSSFSSLPGVTVLRVASSPGPPIPSSSDPARQQAIRDLSDHLTRRIESRGSPRVLCAIVDFQLGWTKEVFWKFDVPVVAFFTFSACAAAMEFGSWKARVRDVGAGEARLIPGLPEEMSMTLSDLRRKPMGGPRPSGAPPGGQGPKPGGGPPKPGDRPPWLLPVEGSIALMFNTCVELEAPFLEYMKAQMGVPAWGVGPLLPDQYWNRSSSIISDREIREHQRDSNVPEDGVVRWLDDKPRRSVLYVAFGSETGPTEEELFELASALGESMRPFIWAIGSKLGSSEMGDKLEGKVGSRGLIIKGWAPQLLILSHPSTGGFLSHCGWNSTTEALGLGVPFLAWPIMGDQHHNTKLVVKYLKVGYKVSEDMSETVRKDQIVKGIDSLMSDEEMHGRARALKAKFGTKFPPGSVRALDAFKEFVSASPLSGIRKSIQNRASPASSVPPTMSSLPAEIIVVPKIGQGHLFPCVELCKHLLDIHFSVTVFVPSDISSSLPSSLLDSPLFHLTTVSSAGQQGGQINQSLEAFITDARPRPVCAIVDHIMYRTQDVFSRHGIPSITFITSGACWAAVQHSAWAIRPDDMQPGEARALPGLPDGMVLSYSDLQQRRHWMPAGSRPSGRHVGPPLPGQPAPWVEEVKASSALLINTCDDLERPFLDYVASLTGKPVWGIGPLLPIQYWQASAELLKHGRGVRPERESNYSDDEVVGWLDKQRQGSVVYVSFGSEVGPSAEEYPELALALEESNRPFIWVIQKKDPRSQVPGHGPVQPGSEYFPVGLDDRVGQRGLVIHGWAPQLLILSHPSTGIFMSHCGWNSTVEAIVRGVPVLAWPIRGDQYYNAKLVVDYLKIGAMVSEGYPAESVNKDDIVKGVEKVLTDEDARRRSSGLKDKFEKGFPESSSASLVAFKDFITGITSAD